MAILSLIVAIGPLVMFLVNRRLFRFDASDVATDADVLARVAGQHVDVLIPARDEEAGVAASIRSILDNDHQDLSVIVLDDHSTDRTAEIVTELAQNDQRVRLIQGCPLPEGWNGKQHACMQLGGAAEGPWLLFLDADVRLHRTAVSRLLARSMRDGMPLLSAFPHQETGTFWERLLIPMMHQILLCFLPFSRMRSHVDPSLAAGCGQLFLTSRQDYIAVGTHEAIRETRHDGIRLPRLYRSIGLMTDAVDGQTIAECRMYRSAGEVFRGLLKNASEGIGSPRLIVPFTFLLLMPTLVPVLLLLLRAAGVWQFSPVATGLCCMALWISSLPRWIAAMLYRQSWLGALLSPLATIVFMMLQWLALIQSAIGYKIAWRGRQ
ncbi:MAG: glycosyltransferase family 2 protein [Planctomycetota bacterium]